MNNSNLSGASRGTVLFFLYISLLIFLGMAQVAWAGEILGVGELATSDRTAVLERKAVKVQVASHTTFALQARHCSDLRQQVTFSALRIAAGMLKLKLNLVGSCGGFDLEEIQITPPMPIQSSLAQARKAEGWDTSLSSSFLNDVESYYSIPSHDGTWVKWPYMDHQPDYSVDKSTDLEVPLRVGGQGKIRAEKTPAGRTILKVAIGKETVDSWVPLVRNAITEKLGLAECKTTQDFDYAKLSVNLKGGLETPWREAHNRVAGNLECNDELDSLITSHLQQEMESQLPDHVEADEVLLSSGSGLSASFKERDQVIDFFWDRTEQPTAPQESGEEIASIVDQKESELNNDPTSTKKRKIDSIESSESNDQPTE